MIKPNLSVGAIFEDGGLCYEVQSVLPNGNYISKKVEKPQNEVTETEQQEKPARKNARGRKKA